MIDCQVCVRVNGKTSAHPKSVFKMSTVCSKSNASSKTWMPLPDRFIDDHLVKMFPLFDQARLQLVDVTNLAAVNTLLQLPPNLAVDWVKVRTVGWPQSWSDEVWCFMDVSMTLRTGCSLTDSNLILGRRNCCGARPVVARTDFQPPHWQSAHRPSSRCPRYVTWASS